MEKEGLDFVTVKTTLPSIPYPPHATRQPITTARLTIRAVQASDLPALHALRSQPEVMTWSSQGAPDPSVEHTSKMLAVNLAGREREMYNFAVCERETGRFVGIGGNHRREDLFGWPALGYMFLSECWGKGFATEFLTAFMEMWWGLPREVVEARVERASVPRGTGEGDVVRECFVGIVQEENLRSKRVLGKRGFEQLKTWETDDSRGPGKVVLTAFGCYRPEGSRVE